MGEENKTNNYEQELSQGDIDMLPERLGYVETAELSEIKSLLFEAVKAVDWPRIISLKSKYLQSAEQVVEQHQGQDFDRAKIGLRIAVGLIMRDGGLLDKYAVELRAVHLYATNLNYDDVLEIVEAELNKLGSEYRLKSTGLPSQEAPKRQFSEEYAAELKQLGARLEKSIPPLPLEVSLNNNELIVGGRKLEASDGPEILWVALHDTKDKIKDNLKTYKEKLAAENPDKDIAADTPMQVMYLANHPFDVLSPAGLDKIDHNIREIHDIEDIKEEFRELWKTIDASGWLAEVRLFANRVGWQPVNLWARQQPRPES